MASTPIQAPEVTEKALLVKNVVMLDVDMLDTKYQVPVYNGGKKACILLIMLCIILNIFKKPDSPAVDSYGSGDNMGSTSAFPAMGDGEIMNINEEASSETGQSLQDFCITQADVGTGGDDAEGDCTLAVIADHVSHGTLVQAKPASILVKRVPPSGYDGIHNYHNVYKIHIQGQTDAAIPETDTMTGTSQPPSLADDVNTLSSKSSLAGGLNVTMNVNIPHGCVTNVQVTVNQGSLTNRL
ncbi:hypothetical protein NEOLEDRAFT_1179694 [Neolentinus lepideus HHB14362 ss-1]|uniref:Uncharacterized protein n=1 Tax=Neolentinus lepideus HHB14362 ss-1 TaxID=1314782 RepID=A0A165RKI2_9AGAM|nr:hypothetical protein NEOLEDRAFT_1179694 [Neolentinus lepideus HHB14362 ss-1]